ncbi:hypothetical protein B7982_00395 [Fibrobacter sp. UWB2]|nr:hypothetical protein B7982_00395 [Fibrobacter sp. UWB2]
MTMRKIIVLLLLLLLHSYAEESVAQKLEKAPIAYYGANLESVLYSIDDKQKLELKLAKNYPEVYKTFIGWADYKQKLLNERLDQAPEKYRHVFEKRNAAMEQHGFFLVHNLVLVEKIYDKNSKTWISPKPEEARKSLFYMAYVGVDISKDSTWKISQRLISLLPNDDNQILGNVGKKRIFFLDGFSQECDDLTESSTLENLHYHPVRLKYDVPENPAVKIREKMQTLVEQGDYESAAVLADSADLSPRSKIIIKILNRDYEFVENKDSTMYYLDNYNDFYYVDKLDSVLDRAVFSMYEKDPYCDIVEKVALYKKPVPIYTKEDNANLNSSIDIGRPTLKGDFPNYDPLLYVGINLNFSMEPWVFGIEWTFHVLESRCDSCGKLDIGIQGLLGFLWLKSKYIEGVVFGNLGSASFVYGDAYIRYGVGTYFDLLFPSYIGKPVSSTKEKKRYGVRLKLGLLNMNNTKRGRAQGILPYVSLGFTWRWVWGMESTFEPSYRPRKYNLTDRSTELDYVDID